jgi:hypothetical protein
MKHTNRNKKNIRKINKKRNNTIRKRGGGGFDEPIISKMRTIKGCFPEFYEPTEDKIGEIKKSLGTLGIDMEKLNIREKPELVEYYKRTLNEYIEDKREIFFDIIDKLLLDNKIPDSKYPKQNIVPTICCMSLIEKMKAITRLVRRHNNPIFNPNNINNLFNPNHIDKPFLEKVENEKNKQDIRKLEIFLENNGIARPNVSTTGKTKADREESLSIYIHDLIQIFNSFGAHRAVDVMLIGVFETKIQDIKNEIQHRENMKKEQEKHAQDQKNKLNSIITNVKGTGGLFSEARKTLHYFSNREKLNIIKELSPGIAKILQSKLEEESDKDSTSIIDDALIDILNEKFKKA